MGQPKDAVWLHVRENSLINTSLMHHDIKVERLRLWPKQAFINAKHMEFMRWPIKHWIIQNAPQNFYLCLMDYGEKMNWKQMNWRCARKSETFSSPILIW
jgi:hypothetical protein